MRGIAWLAENRLASQEGLCSMVQVSNKVVAIWQVLTYFSFIYSASKLPKPYWLVLYNSMKIHIRVFQFLRTCRRRTVLKLVGVFVQRFHCDCSQDCICFSAVFIFICPVMLFVGGQDRAPPPPAQTFRQHVVLLFEWRKGIICVSTDLTSEPATCWNSDSCILN